MDLNTLATFGIEGGGGLRFLIKKATGLNLSNLGSVGKSKAEQTYFVQWIFFGKKIARVCLASARHTQYNGLTFQSKIVDRDGFIHIQRNELMVQSKLRWNWFGHISPFVAKNCGQIHFAHYILSGQKLRTELALGTLDSIWGAFIYGQSVKILAKHFLVFRTRKEGKRKQQPKDHIYSPSTIDFGHNMAKYCVYEYIFSASLEINGKQHKARKIIEFFCKVKSLDQIKTNV